MTRILSSHVLLLPLFVLLISTNGCVGQTFTSLGKALRKNQAEESKTEAKGGGGAEEAEGSGGGAILIEPEGKPEISQEDPSARDITEFSLEEVEELLRQFRPYKNVVLQIYTNANVDGNLREKFVELVSLVARDPILRARTLLLKFGTTGDARVMKQLGMRRRETDIFLFRRVDDGASLGGFEKYEGVATPDSYFYFIHHHTFRDSVFDLIAELDALARHFRLSPSHEIADRVHEILPDLQRRGLTASVAYYRIMKSFLAKTSGESSYDYEEIMRQEEARIAALLVEVPFQQSVTNSEVETSLESMSQRLFILRKVFLG